MFYNFPSLLTLVHNRIIFNGNVRQLKMPSFKYVFKENNNRKMGQQAKFTYVMQTGQTCFVVFLMHHTLIKVIGCITEVKEVLC